jgi:hypothetical protein
VVAAAAREEWFERERDQPLHGRLFRESCVAQIRQASIVAALVPTDELVDMEAVGEPVADPGALGPELGHE